MFQERRFSRAFTYKGRETHDAVMSGGYLARQAKSHSIWRSHSSEEDPALTGHVATLAEFEQQQLRDSKARTLVAEQERIKREDEARRWMKKRKKKQYERLCREFRQRKELR